MKTVYFVLSVSIFFISTKILAQETTYVPDDNFEQVLIDLGYDNTLDNYVITNNINAITELDIKFKAISDLTGIESFMELRYLNCAFNNLINLDLSKNTALEYLDCGFNNLDELDVSSNNALTVLYCDYNNLAILNVNNDNNTNFTIFDARSNSNLNCIDVDNAAYSAANWVNKDETSNYCDDGDPDPDPDPSVEVTYVPDNNFEQALIALGYDTVMDDYVATANISEVTVLNVSNKGINDLTGIEAFIGLTSLNCAKNNLSILDLSNNLSLTYLNCSLNDLSDLDLSNNLLLTNFIGFYNEFVSLNVKNGNNINFTNFDARYNSNLDCIQVDNAAYSTSNWLKKEAVSSYSTDCDDGDPDPDPSVEVTYVPDNNFEQALIALGYDTVMDDYVATTNISEVTVLNVSNKGINDLTGIEAFIGLTSLNCAKNNLSILDLSNNLSLTYLNCSLNDLSDLDLSNNLLLTNFIGFYNEFVSLNVKNGNNINFTNFDARYNSNLDCIQVDNAAYSTSNWLKKEAVSSYSADCDGVNPEVFTYVPDNNFEQTLIALGYDTVMDDYVATANIIDVAILNVSNKGINDLTGIEAFTGLTSLNCAKNNLNILDLSNNLSLTYLNCSLNDLSDLDLSNNLLLTNFIGFYNELVSLNVKNGNNINFTNFDARYNSNLDCIQVDNAAYSTSNWLKKEAGSSYSTNCGESTAKSSNSKELSDNTLIAKQSDINNYKIYPNPVKDILNIALGNGLKLKKVNLYNAYGQRVLTAKTTRIDVNNLKSGVYFVEIETNQEKSTKKIIVD